jgi:hypothetical protein
MSFVRPCAAAPPRAMPASALSSHALSHTRVISLAALRGRRLRCTANPAPARRRGRRSGSRTDTQRVQFKVFKLAMRVPASSLPRLDTVVLPSLAIGTCIGVVAHLVVKATEAPQLPVSELRSTADKLRELYIREKRFTPSAPVDASKTEGSQGGHH